MADVIEKHLACNKFEAWISMDNKALAQYGKEQNAAGDKASCWIASQTDQVSVPFFTVCLVVILLCIVELLRVV